MPIPERLAKQHTPQTLGDEPAVDDPDAPPAVVTDNSKENWSRASEPEAQDEDYRSEAARVRW